MYPTPSQGRIPIELYRSIFCHLTQSQSALRTIRLASSLIQREVALFIRIAVTIDRGTLENQTLCLRRIIEYEGIAPLIRSFRFNGVPKRAEQAQQYQELLSEALRCMPGLEHLDLRMISFGWSEPNHRRQLTNILEGCLFPQLTSVRLDDAAGSEVFYPAMFQHLISLST